MIAIINGKRYDTDAAYQIASCEGGGLPNDWRYFEERLYRTAKGAFFLHGKGGGLSPYFKPVGDMRGPGEKIVPLSEKATVEWLERNGEVSELETYFPHRIEDA